MKITTIINEFESNFASSFKYTSSVKYNVEFRTSVIEDIMENLNKLRSNFEKGDFNQTKVGWDMTLEHIDLLDKLLTEIIREYRKLFYVHPGKLKIYDVNRKLREANAPSFQEFAKGVINELIIPEKKEKLTKAERLKLEAEAFNLAWAFGELRKKEKSK
jgi:hypothetical protein